jgi:hypothetical protein
LFFGWVIQRTSFWLQKLNDNWPQLWLTTNWLSSSANSYYSWPEMIKVDYKSLTTIDRRWLQIIISWLQAITN